MYIRFGQLENDVEHLMILNVINGLVNKGKESYQDKDCAGSLDQLINGRDVVMQNKTFNRLCVCIWSIN